jgi:hypothetical protein
MADRDAEARAEILARLAASRKELRRVFDSPQKNFNGGGSMAGDHPGGFPRSRTMQMLMSGRGIGTLSAIAGGLLIARPALALRLLRSLPASAVAKMLLARAVTALRAKQGGQGG